MSFFKALLHKLNPKVPKRALLFIAAFVWGYAAQKLISIGIRTYNNTELHFWHILVISVPIFLLFHYFVFHKIIIKHTKRIISKPNPSHCLFSFFDWKSYIIMAFMITMGLSLRKSLWVSREFIATFYIGMGLALASSALYLLYYAIRYKYSVAKFSKLEQLDSHAGSI
jgi:hypothetical protein